MSRIYVLITVLLLFSPVLLVGGGSFEVEQEDGLVGDERDVVGWRGIGGGSIDYDPGDTDSSASLGKRFVMGLGWVDMISVTFRLHNESRSVGLCYGVPVGSGVVVEPVPVRSKANRAVSLSLESDSSFDSKNILQTKSVFDFYDYNVVVPALEYRHIYSSVNGSLEEDAGLEADTGLEEKKEEPVLLESRLVGDTTKTFVFGVASPLGVEKDLGVWVFGSFGGGSGSSGDPYEIEDVSQLQNMSGFLSSSFILANDIDASTTASWNGGDGFVPVGNVSAPFTGGFYGDNYTISGLYIDRGDEDFVGLFGDVSGGTVGVVHLVSLNVTGKNYTGGLVGLMDDTVVHNVSVHGVVVGEYNVSAEYDGMISSSWEMTTAFGRVWNINTGNEYGSIQTAITSVTTLDGHTIHAWAGIYTENATITKELEIYGNNTNTIVNGSLTIQSHNTTIRNLVVTGGNILGEGIDVNGNNTLITNTHIHTLDYPITSYNTPTDSLTITQNTIQGATTSIYLLNTNNTLIYDNTINPVGTGDTIVADTCTNTTIHNNNITGRDMVLTGVENTTVHNNIFDTNREVYVESSTDTTIHNNTFLSTPLYAKETNRLYLFHNTFSDTTTAIRIHDCNNTIVDGNDVRNSTNGVLIQREIHSLPGYNTIRHNYLFNNTRGIHLFARHTTIHNNTISNNINGIVIVGISPTYYISRYNKIYHNVFLRNEYHASDDGVFNLWNLSYPQGGNYWSDHQCPDVYSGQYQDIPGSDGVVDDMRHITGSASAKDYYPLIHPEPIAPPTPPPTTAPFEFQLPIGQNCFIVLFILAFLAAFGGMLGGRDREDGTPDNEKRRWHKDD